MDDFYVSKTGEANVPRESEFPDPALQAAAEALDGLIGPRTVEYTIEAFLSALGGRVVVEKLCEHGSLLSHPTIEGIKSDAIELRAGGTGLMSWEKRGMSYRHDCPGGERIVIWEEQ